MKKISEKKLAAFRIKVNKMAEKEFGKVAEGEEGKVQIEIIDLSRFYYMSYMPILKDVDAKNIEINKNTFNNVRYNLSIATNIYENYMSVLFGIIK